MSDLASVVYNLVTINALTDQLQQGLRQRQEDLLGLEDRTYDLAGHRHAGLVIVDQAEDVRRSIDGHVEHQLLGLRGGLEDVNQTLRSNAPDIYLTVADRVGQTLAETSRAIEDLQAVGEALASTSQSLPSDPGLMGKARGSVDLASRRLENARRAVFRVSEIAPSILDGVRDAAETVTAGRRGPLDERPVGLDRLATSVVAELRRRPAHEVTAPEPGDRGPTR